MTLDLAMIFLDGKSLRDFGFGNDFLDMTSLVQAVKKKMNKLGGLHQKS